MNSRPCGIPAFSEGVHYRRTGTGDWKWTTLMETIIRFGRPLVNRPVRYSCRDRRGAEWLAITAESIRIAPGYAWNGSSFSPDLGGVMLASCVHDAIYQFSGCPGWPVALDRAWADDLFFDLATTRRRWGYRLGLAIGGWACWGRQPRDGEQIIRLYPVTTPNP